MEKHFCDRCGAETSIVGRREINYSVTLSSGAPTDASGKAPDGDINYSLTLVVSEDSCETCLYGVVSSLIQQLPTVSSAVANQIVAATAPVVVAEPPVSLPPQ